MHALIKAKGGEYKSLWPFFFGGDYFFGQAVYKEDIASDVNQCLMNICLNLALFFEPAVMVYDVKNEGFRKRKKKNIKHV